jgi:cobalt-zinc-cadmium efflux system protein
MHGPPGHPHHPPAPTDASIKKRLGWALVLSTVYMLTEFVGGYLSNSLALLADAGHMLTDVAALSLSLFAVWIASRPSPLQYTYGYRRAEILAAVANGTTLVAISILILREAVERFQEPEPIDGPLMMGIATGGLLVNLIALRILHGGRNANLNLKGAWLHVWMDMLGSCGAILAGGAIILLGWTWVDPLASILIVGLVLYSALQLLREALSVLMEHSPSSIRVEEVLREMQTTPRVSEVHDLHVWTISSGLNSLSAHVVAEEDAVYPELLSSLREMLSTRFGIEHVTIQIEPPGFEESTKSCAADCAEPDD